MQVGLTRGRAVWFGAKSQEAARERENGGEVITVAPKTLAATTAMLAMLESSA